MWSNDNRDNIEWTNGTLKAKQFIGDGSLLTGIVTGTPNFASNALYSVNASYALYSDIASQAIIADAASVTTCYPVMVTGATGAQILKTDSGIAFNALTNNLTAQIFTANTNFVGNLNGVASSATTAGGSLTSSYALVAGVASTALVSLSASASYSILSGHSSYAILSGQASNALTVTTNANLTGIVTSVGNATKITAASVSEALLLTTDNTDLNASTTKHGFLKKLDNTATNYMDGTGNWSVPAGAAGGSGAFVLIGRRDFSSVTNASFASFDPNYNSYQLVTNVLATNDAIVRVRFNSDGGNNYQNVAYNWSGGTMVLTRSAAQSGLWLANSVGTGQGVFSVFQFHHRPDNRRFFCGNSGYMGNIGDGQWLQSGLYSSTTTLISTVEVNCSAGTMSGSVLLYGRV
jgi:hypothetical protein